MCVNHSIEPPASAEPMDPEMTSTLQKLKRDRRVEIVDDERSSGNGVIITLRQGWTFDASADNRVAGEDTVSEALKLLRSCKPFAGPYTD